MPHCAMRAETFRDAWRRAQRRALRANVLRIGASKTGCLPCARSSLTVGKRSNSRSSSSSQLRSVRRAPARPAKQRSVCACGGVCTRARLCACAAWLPPAVRALRGRYDALVRVHGCSSRCDSPARRHARVCAPRTHRCTRAKTRARARKVTKPPLSRLLLCREQLVLSPVGQEPAEDREPAHPPASTA